MARPVSYTHLDVYKRQVLVVERMLEVKGDNDVTFILVNDTRKAMAHLAAHFYRMPTQDLSLVGITGTNGKTTTAHLVEHIASTLRCV